MNPTLEKVVNLWMNDETIFIVHSDMGDFEISKDCRGGVFIMNVSNQAAIDKIHELLKSHEGFDSLDVDPEDYKLKE